MARHIDKLWLVLLALAIGTVVACGSSDTSSGGNGNEGTGAPDAMSGG
jgi:hypothetical protein